ncbi:MAG: tetratricopeptide repeat protein [Nitrospira sp.]|nr:tetratricopeptide repeat protein [Nitrospira sp.]
MVITAAKQAGQWIVVLWLGLLTACGTPSAPPRDPMLPPSASDLELLGATRLCETENTVVRRWQGVRYERMPWGSGEQLQRSAQRGQPGHDAFYFFNDEQRLVGAVFRYNQGLSLKPYPLLRETLSELRPSSTFYIDPTQLLSKQGAQSAVLYRTGDYTSTTQYLVLETEGDPTLLVASLAIDPYEQLLSSYHETFLPGLNRSRSATPGKPSPEAADDFPGLQQFARGEAALFGSCGTAQPAIAVDAYRQSIQHGLKDESRLAEAHHRLGLALRDQGQQADAQRELEQALSLRPNSPAIISNLGRVLAEQHQSSRAIELFKRALVLAPNYAEARFNLAKSLEQIDTRRAIEEYETYLALVEGIPSEAKRIMFVLERVKRLKGE